MKNVLKAASVLALLAVSACAAGTEASHHAAQNGPLSQLLLGFWHGIIAPITLIGEIINKLSPGALPWKFGFYEGRETSVVYDVGFFVGIFVGPSGVWTGATRRRVGRRGISNT
jgi:hypothetical protein